MKAFLSYSRQDNEWVRGAGLSGISAPPMMEWVKEQLAMIGAELWIDTHLEEQIGGDFEEDIRTRLMQADLAIVLVSQDYITSKFIASKEMAIIRQRVDKGEMQIFPIIVSAVIWQHNDMAQWIKRFQVYPASTRPLQNEISSLRDIKMHRTEILRLIKNIMAERSARGSPRATIEQPSIKSPVDHQLTSAPKRTPKLRFVLGGLAVALLLTLVACFLRFPFGKKTTSPDSTTPAVYLSTPVLRAELKNLDFPPAVYGSSVGLDWTAFSVPDTDTYEVEVSKSQDFPEEDTFAKQTAQGSLTLERAQKYSKLMGRLYWRVRIIRTKGAETSKGPWSETGAFEVYDTALSKIVLSQRLVVGTSAIQNLPGDTVRKRGAGDFEGLDADIVSDVVMRLRIKLSTPNLSVQYVNMAWNELLPALARNQVDIAISGITASEAREREYHVKFSRSYYSTAQVVMALKSSGVTSLADALKRKAYSIEGRSGNRVAQAVFSSNEVAPGGAHYDKLFEVLRDHPDAVAIHDYAMLYSQAVSAGTADQYSFFPIVSSDLPEEKRAPFLNAHNGEDCDRWAIAVADSQVELLNEINGCVDWLYDENKLAQLIVHHNYPESSLQSCQVTVATLKAQTEPVNDVKPVPKAPSTNSPAEKLPTPVQKPAVDTVPY